MSENSLRIRQKFINKFNSKLEDLTDDLDLLLNVDRKIFKKITQRGGADGDIALKDIQVSALTKKLQLAKQNKDLEEAITKAKDLETKLSGINSALQGIKKDIESMEIVSKSKEIAALQKVPDVESYHPVVMASLENLLLWDDASEIAAKDDTDPAKSKYGITKDVYVGLLNAMLKVIYAYDDAADLTAANHDAVKTSLDAAAKDAAITITDDVWAALKANKDKKVNADGSVARKYLFW